MSGVIRLPSGGEIDRRSPIGFTFDGRHLSGLAGDTIASALLANNVRIVGRSFKYHRPRGVFSAGIEEPNATLDLRHGSRHDPNAHATIEPLAEGMAIASIHALGSAAHDRLAFIDRFARFIPAAFYYKTFMWPNWRFYEARIRAMAGWGRLDPDQREGMAAHRFANVDCCVIGAGAAGLAAALASMRAGKRIMVIDEQSRPGGMLSSREAEINGEPAGNWIAEAERKLREGGATFLLRSTAFGIYDHNEVAIVERGLPKGADGNGECVWRVRAGKVIVATGAIERPMLFADNDRPGIMLAGAALSYLRRQALRLGEKVVIATANDTPYELALALNTLGSKVTIVDQRPAGAIAAEAAKAGIGLRFATSVKWAQGARGVTAAKLDNGEEIPADFVFTSGGWTPSIHLYCQAGGRPRWDPAIGAFLPGDPVDGVAVAGAARGTFDLARALAEGHAAGGGTTSDAPTTRALSIQWGNGVILPPPSRNRRVWVDLQNDVTMGDVGLAVRENFASVEHLKRYTTLGMATDQGKTSNLNGLAVLAATTGRDISALGLTTFRPPYAPVSMATIAGPLRGELHTPIRRLPAESVHRDEGAYFREYGGILRPAWYGADKNAIAAECLRARSDAIVFDGSSLGKVEVIGPGAASLLDFVFYTRMSTLLPGRLRYGLMLNEGGVIMDDSVVLRLAPERFVVSCSSSHVAMVASHFEEWRQDRFDTRGVFVHDATPHWATIAIAGPRSRSVIDALDFGIPTEDTALPHMAMREGMFMGRNVRVSRVSFIGERSYEISLPANLVTGLWRKARTLGAQPIGVEALSVLRAEKGYIIVGQDTDGETMPHDIGMPGPREKRQDAYVGDRSLFTPAATRHDRRQLVGIAVEGDRILPPGAHAIEAAQDRRRSLGLVTTGFRSPTLGRPIALGLVENGLARIGEAMVFEHLGERLTGRIAAPCFLDPEGRRLHA